MGVRGMKTVGTGNKGWGTSIEDWRYGDRRMGVRELRYEE